MRRMQHTGSVPVAICSVNRARRSSRGAGAFRAEDVCGAVERAVPSSCEREERVFNVAGPRDAMRRWYVKTILTHARTFRAFGA